MSEVKKKKGMKETLLLAARIIRVNFQLMWRRNPVRAVTLTALMLIPGAVSGLSAPLLERFVQSLEQAAGGAGLGVVAVAAGLLLGVKILEKIMNGVRSYMESTNDERVRCDLSQEVMKSLARKEPICFENVDMLNYVEKARQGADYFPAFYDLVIGEGMYTISYALVVFVYMGTRSPLICLMMVLSLIPMMLSSKLIRQKHQDAEEKTAPVRRAVKYMESSLTGRESYKETRILGAFPFFNERYMKHIKEWTALSRRLLIQERLISASNNIVSVLGLAGMIVVMLLELLNGRIETAAFAAIFASLMTMFSELKWLVTNGLHYAASRLPPIENMFHAMDLPERQGKATEADGSNGVTLTDVRFRYPGAENESVRGVTLDIRPRETIAVVGENGAGKTTLVRLLTGLYLPTEGSVKIGGEDTKQIDLPSAMKNTSAVFQKYMKYKLNLDENVRISETAKQGDIEQPLSEAGLPVDSACFPEGKDTMLSREFDGVDLSGGQWQRVAIARGLYRAHGMIVLDEPTAAIDPLEETRVYRKFAELSRDKTAVIVTHRMGSARIADRIVVMKDGVIEDIGSHDELMARGGEYARMVNAQAAWYTEEEASPAADMSMEGA